MSETRYPLQARTGSNERAQGGFSLLELLVAMTIMGFLGSAMAAGLRLGINIWQRASAHVEAQRESLAMRDTLSTLIGQADAAPYRFDGVLQAAFAGTPESLRFVSEPPLSLTDRQPRWFEIALVGDTLVLTMSRFDEQSQLTAPANPQTHAVLIEGLEGLELSYFGEGGNTGPQWTESWLGNRQLPDLISVSVTASGDDTRPMPPMIFATRQKRR